MFRPLVRVRPGLRAVWQRHTLERQSHALVLSVPPPTTSGRFLGATKTGLVLERAGIRVTKRYPWNTPGGVAHFHSTPGNQGPLIPLLLGALKASTTLEVARTAGRIALTFLPLLLIKNRFNRKYIKHHEHFHNGEPVPEERKALLLQRIRTRTIIFHMLLFIPVALFWVAILASAERTPLTGRWRLIILSPEEEDDIAAQLAGPQWYQAVSEVLASDGSPTSIPTDNWRYQWVQDTLRRLESVIPILQHEQELSTKWLDTGSAGAPLPPPAEYPLRPRPRASDTMRKFTETLCGRKSSSSAHVIAGPPYSLLIVDKPDASNAFSYGFGPDGASGIVIYSGFLDDILSKAPSRETAAPQQIPEKTSWLPQVFGSFFAFSPPSSSVRPHPTPTQEQTEELAILLAHEVAHLVLSHHLETLSSATIIVPAVISMAADIARTLLFPITMLFGPFVNDAVAQQCLTGD